MATKRTSKSSTSPTEDINKTLEGFNGAYTSYLELLQKIWEKHQENATQAYQDYSTAYNEARDKSDAYDLISAAHKQYTDADYELQKGLKDNYETAFNNYLSDMAKAWGNANTKELNAASLAGLSHQMYSAACYARSTSASN